MPAFMAFPGLLKEMKYLPGNFKQVPESDQWLRRGCLQSCEMQTWHFHFDSQHPMQCILFLHILC